LFNGPQRFDRAYRLCTYTRSERRS